MSRLKSIGRKILDWLKSLDRVTVLTILVIWILAGTFYWFQWRPSTIRKECHAKAVAGARLKINHPTQFNREDYNFYYDQCTHSKGLR